MSTFTVHIPFVEMIGFELISCDAGRAEIAVTLRDDLCNTGHFIRVQRRLGLHAVEHAAHQRGVAIDVGADLHDGCAAVTAGQRHQIGLGQDHRNVDRAPDHVFETEDEAQLLGERRGGVVVQDEFGRGVDGWSVMKVSAASRAG